ncbi:hypothetical protein BJ138DRAFT_1143299 [Hygrophoropsis aurantiaca]|uniref:Uncharacterized protein n=1 Tax=Hygrophoropsis aurantiaca TaxID=72124 RepID=A0ACB8AMM8_9AGAM|nr:hypothetical protein BJ138DRAFT_1143299 [Hygrophoropsis aurantiaca]
MQPIILYDIPSKLPGNHWSPNPAKTRFALSFKGLPFETEWVEYPDIADFVKSIGGPPTDKKPDGSDIYTLPVIKDPNTGTVVSDSFLIAEYLETSYPSKALFPPNTKGLIGSLEPAFNGVLHAATRSPPSILVATEKHLNPISVEYFARTKPAAYGKDWEGLKETWNEDWAQMKAGLNTVSGWYEKTGGKWLMGDIFSYADMIVAARILWLKQVLDEADWNELSSWNNGKWTELLADVERECSVVHPA